ncbi:MAG: signal transduction histidine kinase/ligand-binding sensor domain-containing protein [Phenylobacterium sp.]|jgi:signal transduction histidine kinase/ligand-binding sensor domain-containing protein
MRLIITLLLLFAVFISFVTQAAPVTRFDRVSIELGLSQVTVLSIVQDYKGFLWFGTQDGLNRYDGYNFKVFRHNPDDPHSISDNDILNLTVDSAGSLWIGTDNGLNRYDANTERFSQFKHNSAAPNSLSHNSVWAIVEQSAGVYWIGTNGGGLNRFNSATGLFKHYQHQANDPASLSSNHIRALYKDSKGSLWLGTLDKGLNRFNPQQQTFDRFAHNPSDPHSLSDNFVRAITEDNQGALWLATANGLNRLNLDAQRSQAKFTRYSQQDTEPNSLSHHDILSLFKDSNGVLWIGTDGGGLNRYNAHSEDFSHFEYQEENLSSLGGNRILSMHEDNQGGLWFGTRRAGLSKITPQRQHFGHFKHQRSDPASLSHSAIWSIYQDLSNTLWVGTEHGLNRNRPTADNSDSFDFEHFNPQPSNPESLSHDRVQAIKHDSHGNLWVGTFGGGLNRYEPNSAKQSFTHFKYQPSDPNSLRYNHVTTLFEDSKKNLWVGTSGGGLNRYNPQTQNFLRFDLNHGYVICLIEDDNGTLWVGTNGGLYRFDSDDLNDNTNKHFPAYQHQPSQPNSLSHNNVQSLYQDSQGSLWIGTSGGLNKFDIQSQTFTHYKEENGLANDSIYGILADDQGLLWLSTNKGIARFNPLTEQFKHYDVNDGLQSDEFNQGAHFKSGDGELFFGGINGLNRFFPADIKDDKQPPQVVFTDFLLVNRSVPVNASGDVATAQSEFSLSKSIDNIDNLTLTYEQNLVAFEFAGLHFTNPMKNQYAYKLEGQDKDWIYTDAKNRRATYTNLAAGDYTLRIKASNKDGYWTEPGQGRTLKITMLPPPWKTWWAYWLYVAALTALLLLIRFTFVQQRNILTQQQKHQDEQILNQQLKQVDKLKDEFLANTSHELRTPLNGIIGLAESLIDGIAGPQSPAGLRNLGMIVSSGRRLSNLVNDVLDFSKLKNRNLVLNTKAVDIYSMVEVVLTLSQPLVGHKPLTLINGVDKKLPAVHADEDRLAQIFHNLVGNAIKFTDAGQVTVAAVKITEGEIQISVSDTGIGIEQLNLATIFDSFEQLEGHTERQYSGTGLGLSVSKQLVALHGGTLVVESEMGSGSTFSFMLAVSQDSALCNTSANTGSVTGAEQLVSRLHRLEDNGSPAVENTAETGSDKKSDDGRFRILLVDDEPINRQVLHNHLSLQNYQLIEATGGQQALDVISQDGPFDLILLDVMMPGVSGYEVCTQLREIYPSNDLPVIFLTAKNQVADMVQSFAVGANDYLSKPVSKHELLTRVETHLKFLDIHRDLEGKVSMRTKALIDTQQQLIQSEKMAALGTLTAGVAHEINNPTSFVHVSSQNLEVDLGRFQQFLFDLAGDASEAMLDSFRAQFAPLYGHLSTIKNGTERIKIIVEDLHAFTQLDSAEQKTVVVTDLLQSTINLVQTQHLELTDFVTDFQATPALNCYPAQLNQVFMNLIVNACDAIREAAKTVKGEIVIGCRVNGDAIEVSIKDNGCGMSEETKTKLFEPFYTTKEVGEGTGLGLSISFGIVQKHGAQLSVESQLGVGTTFLLRLPL